MCWCRRDCAHETVIFSALGRGGRRRGTKAPNDRLRLEKKPEMSVKKMVQCPICGVHFAEVDGVWMNGKSYCSLACAQKAEDEAHSQH